MQVCITKKIMHPNMKHIPIGCITVRVFSSDIIFTSSRERGKIPDIGSKCFGEGNFG